MFYERAVLFELISQVPMVPFDSIHDLPGSVHCEKLEVSCLAENQEDNSVTIP